MKGKLLFFAFLSLIMGTLDGRCQSVENWSIERLLLEIDQTSDEKILETAIRTLQRKTPTTEEERARLIQALDHARVEVQLAAAIALGNAQVAEAVPKLLQKLESIPPPPLGETLQDAWEKKAHLAEALIAALAQIGDERAIEPLLKYPDSLHMGVRPVAAFGAKALPSILRIAHDPNDPRRRTIVGAIGQIRDPQAIPLLSDALRDSEAEIRLNAIGALRAMNVKEVEPAFQRLLMDPEAPVRIAALHALLTAEPDKYLPAAVRFLKDRSPYVRGQTIDLLARTGKPEVIEPLEKSVRDPNDIVRYKAAKTLEKLTGKVYPYKRTQAVELFEKEESEPSRSRRQP